MRNQDTIQTQQMKRRLFMYAFGYAFLCIPLAVVSAFLGILLWSELFWAFCGLFAVTGIAAGCVAGFWYADSGVPMKLNLSKKPSKRDLDNEDYLEFHKFKEQQEVRRLMAADANEIVFKDEVYYRQRDWGSNSFYWESYSGQKLTLPRELT